MKEFKLPKRLLIKRTTPYEVMYQYIAKKLGISVNQMDVSRCIITTKTAKTLLVLMKQWGRAYTVFRGKSLDKAISWDHFQYGPVEKNGKEYKDGYFYYKTEKENK